MSEVIKKVVNAFIASEMVEAHEKNQQVQVINDISTYLEKNQVKPSIGIASLTKIISAVLVSTELPISEVQKFYHSMYKDFLYLYNIVNDE